MMKRVTNAIIALVLPDQRVRKQLVGLRLAAVALLFMHGNIKITELNFDIFPQGFQNLVDVRKDVGAGFTVFRKQR